MPLHPQAAAFLQRRNRDGVRPDHELTVAQTRANAEQTPDPTTLEPVGHIQERLIRSPGVEHPVRVRIYTPTEPPLGVVLYLHGGGHVTGTLDSYDALTRRLSNRVPATVVAVDYRRAPEHRCPAAVDDAETAYRWVLRHANDLGISGSRSVALAGDSAGGNNAAVLAQRLRDAGAPPAALQVLLYPTLDAAAYRTGTAYPSYRDCAQGYGLTYPDGLWYWNHYLGPDGDPTDPAASPLRATTLAGLPPAYLLTVQYDVLRDEGTAYAERLRAAGVPVQHRQWDGHLHGSSATPAPTTTPNPPWTRSPPPSAPRSHPGTDRSSSVPAGDRLPVVDRRRHRAGCHDVVRRMPQLTRPDCAAVLILSTVVRGSSTSMIRRS